MSLVQLMMTIARRCGVGVPEDVEDEDVKALMRRAVLSWCSH